MARGQSLHVGLNFVDPDQYEGWDGELAACEFDAKDMQAMAKSLGYATERILTKSATADAVIDGIESAAGRLKKGDFFLLTYSGHGGQVRDLNGDEKRNGKYDRYDETWVLRDRQLVDDELYELFGKFKSGVRIVVLSDSCHSGSVVRDVPSFVDGGPRRRAMPRSVGVKVEAAHRKTYEKIQKDHPAAESTVVRASVLLVSGCQDNQYSQDGDRNGLFTGTLMKVWNKGKFAQGYRRFRDEIVSRMPSDQTPNYYSVGVADAKFESSRPFRFR